MSLINARAALEEVIEDSLRDNHPRLTVIFDNAPLTGTAPSEEYVLISIDFDQSTLQPLGDAVTFYEGKVSCVISIPFDQGTKKATQIAETLITGLTDINKSSYVDKYSVVPKVREIEGPTSVRDDDETHYLSVVSCVFTANG